MYGMEIALKQTKIISMQSIFSLLFYIIYIHEIFKVNEPKRIPDITKEILQWASGRLKLLLFVILFLLCLFLILICITYYFTENSKHFLGLCAIMAYEQYFLIRMYSSMNSISISCMHDYQYINIVALANFYFYFLWNRGDELLERSLHAQYLFCWSSHRVFRFTYWYFNEIHKVKSMTIKWNQQMFGSSLK